MSGADESTLKRPAGPGPVVASARVLALTILAHPDPRRVGELAILDGTTSVSRLEPELGPPGAGPASALGDRQLSRRPLRLDVRRDEVTITPAEDGSPIRVEGTPAVAPVVCDRDALDRGVVLEIADRVALLLHRRARPQPGPELGLLGASDVVERLRDEIRRVADLPAPVCVLGETGVGKERTAAAIHAASGRTGPFVAINMATVPHATAVSQLFGHRRGAFTGADVAHRGMFHEAAGGTLLLDEIADCSDQVQAMLLRTLETGEVMPLGGDRGEPVDVRVIAATDRDLVDAVRAGTFRGPLWHRLAGYVLRVPPLRARRDDIARLFHHFLADELAATGMSARLEPVGGDDDPWLPAPVVAALCRADWPGNLRELRNVARRIVVASRGLDDLVIDDEVAGLIGAHVAVPSNAPAAGDDLATALERHGWKVAATAAALGISRTTLYARMDASPEIRKARDVSADELAPLIAETGRDLDAMAARLRVSRRGLQLRLRELGL
jgi:two-component system nitrogen regulation response regulator GlnG